MLKPKTHYEQVPLEVVREIVDEQIRREIPVEQDHGIENGTREGNLLRAQNRSGADWIFDCTDGIRRSGQSRAGFQETSDTQQGRRLPVKKSRIVVAG